MDFEKLIDIQAVKHEIAAQEYIQQDVSEQLSLAYSGKLYTLPESNENTSTLSVTSQELQSKCEALYTALQSFPELLDKTSRIATDIERVGKDASQATARVRELDILQSNTNSVIEHVQNIIDLRTCTQRVHAAMEQDDIFAAAEGLAEFQRFARILPIDQDEKNEMNTIRDSIISRLQMEIDSKMPLQADSAIVARVCKQLAMLGEAQFGWKRSSELLSMQLQSHLVNLIQNFTNNELQGNMFEIIDAIDFSSADTSINLMSGVFGATVDAIEDGAQIIETALRTDQAFSNHAKDSVTENNAEHSDNSLNVRVDGAITIIRSIHQVCDPVAARVLHKLLRSDRLQTAIDISRGKHQNFKVDGLDLRSQECFDAIVDEVALVLQRVTSYFRAVRGATYDCIFDTTQSMPDIFDKHRDLIEAAGELSAIYSVLEQGVVQRGILKAISLDELIELTPAVSSLIEDTFFVFQKSIRRAFATGNIDCICAIVSQFAENITQTKPYDADASTHAVLAEMLTFTHKSANVPKEAFKNIPLHTIRSILECYATCDLNDGSGRRISGSQADKLRASTSNSVKAFASPSTTHVRSNSFHTGASPATSKKPSHDGFVNVSIQKATDEFYSYVAMMNSENFAPGKSSRESNEKSASGIQGQFTQLWKSVGTPTKTKLDHTRGASQRFEHDSTLPVLARPIRTDMDDTSVSYDTSTEQPIHDHEVGSINLKDSSQTKSEDLLSIPIAIVATSCVLNSFGTCCSMVQKLQQEIKETLYEVFPDEIELIEKKTQSSFGNVVAADVAKLSSILDLLSTSINDLQRDETAYIARLCGLLSPRIRGAMTLMEGKNSVLRYDYTTEEDKLQYDVFENEFIPSLKKILHPFVITLHQDVKNSFVHRIASYVARQIESHAMRKQYTFVGALSFDKDIQKLVDFFVRQSDRSVKMRLDRLVQMAQILCFESPQEVAEALHDSNSTTWDLTQQEAHRVFGLRTEFDSDALDTIN